MRALVIIALLALSACSGSAPMRTGWFVTQLYTDPPTAAPGETVRVLFRYDDSMVDIDIIPGIAMHCTGGMLYAVPSLAAGPLPSRTELDDMVDTAHIPPAFDRGQLIGHIVGHRFLWSAPDEPGTYTISASMVGGLQPGSGLPQAATVVEVR